MNENRLSQTAQTDGGGKRWMCGFKIFFVATSHTVPFSVLYSVGSRFIQYPKYDGDKHSEDC